jgi:hypothetical protein
MGVLVCLRQHGYDPCPLLMGSFKQSFVDLFLV